MRQLLVLAPLALAIAACNCGEEAGFGKVAPNIEVSPEMLAFGEVPVGATKRVRLTVRNTGSFDLEISSVDAMAPFGAKLADNVVRTGSESSIDVSFSPSNDEPQSGALLITSTDPDQSMLTIPLSGRGVQGLVTVRPPMVDHTNTSVGTTRTAEIFFSNLGIESVEGRIVTEGFPRPEHFTLTGVANFADGAPLGIPARSEVELDLVYRPIELGEDHGRIFYELCGERCGVEVDIRASAVQAVIQVEPPAVDFGTVGIGSSKSQPVLVTNSGQVAVQVTSVQTAGGAELTAVPTRPTPAVVEGNSSMAINLEFRPSSAAQFSGELIVKTNDPVVPEARVRVVGRGEGPLFVVQPDAIAFGIQREPATYERSLLLLNSGSADVRVEGISSSGNRFGLADVPGLPARLGSGQSMVVKVTFSPDTIAEYMGEVRIRTDDPNNAMVTVSLSGGLTNRLCELEMSSGRVNFGLMPVGFSRDKSVTVRNAGTDMCVLSSGAFRAPIDPALTAVAAGFPTFPTTLAPGQAIPMTFNYTPTMMIESKANFVFMTDDPVFPERHLSLLGSALGYVDIFTRPDRIDFGTIRPTCSAGQREVRIYNAGTADALVESISMTPPVGEISLMTPVLPFNLGAGNTQEFYVDFTPADLGAESTLVEVTVRDLPFPLVVPVHGEGTTNPRTLDQYTQERNQMVDVLFVIDDSCSMADDQSALAMNIRSFIRQADVRSVDFRMGITTTTIFPSPGALVGPVMRPSTASLESEFQRQANVGVMGSGIEQGLDAMVGALQLAAVGIGHNADLRRAGATLVAIIVSDEDDQSSATPVFYLNALRNNAPAGFLVGVVSGQAMGCGVQGNAGQGASPALRYEDFVAISNGISESICSSWANTLANLGNAAFGLRTLFVLSKEADTREPINVLIDGVPAAAGSWMYDPSDHSIRFTNPPPEGSTVSVEYTPSC